VNLSLLLISSGFASATVCAVSGVPHAAALLRTREWRHGERPPMMLRLCGPLVRPMAHLIGPRLPPAWRERLLRRLQQAELERALMPEEWLAGTVLFPVLAAALGAAVSAGTGMPTGPAVALGLAAGAAWGPLWLRDQIARRRRAIMRDLPVYLDVITLAVECGCGLTAAMAIVIEKAPSSPLRRALERWLHEVRTGRARADALRALDARLDMPAISALTAALIQAESCGASLGPTLRAQAGQRAQERFARAEKLAMEAPLKLLAPLILCIFPCTFIVLGFPVAVRLLQGM